jgi:hypothetical protein
MPYIKGSKRPQYENVLDELLRTDALTEPGHLNYVLFALVRRYLSEYGQDYETLRNIRAELLECHTEIGRRLLADYEDLKMRENGDVW